MPSTLMVMVCQSASAHLTRYFITLSDSSRESPLMLNPFICTPFICTPFICTPLTVSPFVIRPLVMSPLRLIPLSSTIERERLASPGVWLTWPGPQLAATRRTNQVPRGILMSRLLFFPRASCAPEAQAASIVPIVDRDGAVLRALEVATRSGTKGIEIRAQTRTQTL